MMNKINKILESAGLERVHQASVIVERFELSSQQELRDRINGFPQAVGWLCLTDEVVVVRHDSPMPRLEGRIILSGELASGAKSIHIRQNDAFWELYLLKRTEGGEQILVEESFLSTHRGEGNRLKYEVFWRPDELGAFAPFAARFAGFEKGGAN